MMAKILVFFLIIFSPLSAKIYDCFLFFNEFEILKIRMAELDEVVDYYVLVESHETFKGNSKPLYFEENKELFAPFLEKIIHVVVERHEGFFTPWRREKYHRNAILRGLRSIHSDDIVIISDCDEIPKKELILELQKSLCKNPNLIHFALQKFFRFRLNLYQEDQFPGSCVVSGKTLRRKKPHSLRKMRNQQSPKIVHHQNGGWHFSSIGNMENLKYKYNSFSHDCDAEKHVSEWLDNLKIVEIDESYSDYVQDNISYFRSLGLILDP